MKGQREIAGLWCQDVLARLYDFLDGTLSDDERDRVRAHLDACSRCSTFGTEAGALVQAVRARIADPGAVSDALERRILARLDEV